MMTAHNLDVIKTADWLIDMGPEGGAGGGMVVAQGTPEQVAASPASYTGRYLGRLLAARKTLQLDDDEKRHSEGAFKPLSWGF